MKNLFRNKMKKIAVFLAMLILFNFTVPTYSQATDPSVLVDPIKYLFVDLIDGVLSWTQNLAFGGYIGLLPIKETIIADKNEVLDIVNGTLNIISPYAWVKNLAGSLSGKKNAYLIEAAEMEGRTVVTNYNIFYTPDLIFRGKIYLFDIDFFSNEPKGYDTEELQNIQEQKEELEELKKRLETANYSESTQGYRQLYKDIGRIYYLSILTDKTSSTAYTIKGFHDMCCNRELSESGSENEKIEMVKFMNDKISEYKNIFIETADIAVENFNLLGDGNYSTAYEIRKGISKGYNFLRRIAIVAMMIVLIYLGIRILLTSIANDKAKYKKMLIDWVVAMCLLFLMHYLMVFLIKINEKIIDILYMEDTAEYITIIRKGIDNSDIASWGYVVAYIIWVCQLLYFSFVYLKRVIYMAFLTLISPIVAFSYPIDKVKDGQAQAFNMWLKEYIFNLLIQPMHLILYTILMGTAVSLAEKNVLYVIIVLAFLMQAEKIVRSFFGFDKARTPGMIPGTAGGALMMEGFKKLTGWGPGGKRGSSDGKAENSGSSSNVRTASLGSPYAGIGGSSSSGGSSTGSFRSGSTGNGFVPSGNSTITVPLADSTTTGTNISGGNDGTIGDDGMTLDYSDSGNGYRWNTSEPEEIDVGDGTSVPLDIGNGVDYCDSSWLGDEKDNEVDADEDEDRPKGLLSAYGEELAAYGRKLKRDAKRKITAKNLVGVGFRAMGAFAGAAIGLGIGASQGDFKSALNGTIIGAQGGQRALGGASDAAFNGYKEISSIGNEAYGRARYGNKEYEARQRKKELKKWIPEHEEELIRNLGSKEYRELAKKGGDLQKYYDYGLQDIGDIKAAQELRKKHSNEFKTAEDAIKGVKIAKQMKSFSKKDDKRKELEYYIRKNNKSMKDETVQSIAKRYLDYIDTAEDAMSKVK